MAKINFTRDLDRNRSDRYQFLLVESSCSPELLTEFSDSKGMARVLNDSEYNEELHELKEQLIGAFWRIIRTKLTARQCQVIELYAKGMTQIEIAKQLNVNQSSITKSINGNCDYKKERRVYGGAKKKLRRIAAEDDEVITILTRIAEIQEEVDC